MELFVQQPKCDQKCQNFCLLLVFSIKFMKPSICKVYPAIPHGIEVEHWSVYPKGPGSNLVGSRFFFSCVKKPLFKFRPLFGLFGLGYGQNAKISPD